MKKKEERGNELLKDDIFYLQDGTYSTSQHQDDNYRPPASSWM